jgi:predicted ester cyclase
MMRKILMITVVLIAVLPLLTMSGHVGAQQSEPATQPTDPEGVLRAIFAALNGGDVEGAMALVAEDAVFVHIPPPPGIDDAIGKEGLREWWNMFVERHGRIEITEIYVHGDKVAFAANVSEDFFTSKGIPVMVAEMVAIVQGGLLESFTITFTEASGAIFAVAFSREENRAMLGRAYEEVFNGKNLAVLDEQIAPDAVDHSFPDLSGVDAFKIPIGGLLAAFPDLQVTPEFIVADGDMVMALATFTGTHQGEFLGVPPTGKQITWSHVDINRIQDGKVVEAWHIGSREAILQALGYQLSPPTE